MKNVTIQNIPIKEDKFFILWLTLINPFNKLRNKEIIVLAKILEVRNKLSETIKNEEDINVILFSTQSRKKITVDLNISEFVLNNILASLRKKKIITGTSIKKSIIPNFDNKKRKFNLLFNIDVL